MLRIRLVRVVRKLVTRGLERWEERSFRVPMVLISLAVALQSTLRRASGFVRTRG